MHVMHKIHVAFFIVCLHIVDDKRTHINLRSLFTCDSYEKWPLLNIVFNAS